MKKLVAIILIAIIVLTVGCARTKQARTTKQTGFLGKKIGTGSYYLTSKILPYILEKQKMMLWNI